MKQLSPEDGWGMAGTRGKLELFFEYLQIYEQLSKNKLAIQTLYYTKMTKKMLNTKPLFWDKRIANIEKQLIIQIFDTQFQDVYLDS